VRVIPVLSFFEESVLLIVLIKSLTRSEHIQKKIDE